MKKLLVLIFFCSVAMAQTPTPFRTGISTDSIRNRTVGNAVSILGGLVVSGTGPGTAMPGSMSRTDSANYHGNVNLNQIDSLTFMGTTDTVASLRVVRANTGGSETMSSDSIHAKSYFIRNSAGLDTAMIAVDASGNAAFYYRIPAYTDSAQYRDATSYSAYNEGCNSLPDDFAQIQDQLYTPANLDQAFSIRYMQDNVVISHRLYTYLSGAYYARFSIWSYNTTTHAYGWNIIGTYDFSNVSDTDDDTVGGTITITTRDYDGNTNPTFADLGLAANTTYPFRLKVAYHNIMPIVPPNVGCQPNPAYSQTVQFDSLLFWTPGGSYAYPARWVESGRFEHDTLIVRGITASGTVDAANLVGDIGTINSTQTLGSVGGDTTQGVLSLMSQTGHLASLSYTADSAITVTMPTQSGEIGLTKNFPTVTGSGVIDVSHVGVNYQVSLVGTDTAWSPSYQTQPADCPPDTSQTLNDEFSDTSVDAKWKWRNQVDATATEAHGVVNFAVPHNAAVKGWRMLVQDIPAADTAGGWSITAKISFACQRNGYIDMGLVCFNTASKRLMTVGPRALGSPAGYYMQVLKYTDSVTYSATSFAAAEFAPVSYIRISKSVTDSIFFYVSYDGITWDCRFKESCTTFIEATGVINLVGITINNNNATYDTWANFWWFRYKWNADFDPLTDN